MTHNIKIESADSLVLLDALKLLVEDPEFNQEDRDTAQRLFENIVDLVREDLKECD